MSTPEPSARASKRQRPEDPPDLSAAKRHDKHWCRDGSVVLHVEDALFRVHQSTLERVSEAFKDLFAVPQPEDEACWTDAPLSVWRATPVEIGQAFWMPYMTPSTL